MRLPAGPSAARPPARSGWRPLAALGALALLAWAPPLAAEPGLLYAPDPARWAPKDFSIVQDDQGRYHAFYILTNLTSGLDYHWNERRFGHSRSPDLVNWAFVDSGFAVRPDGWDRDHLWAPSLLRDAGGRYWMFYTGVGDVLVQVSPPRFEPRLQSIGAAFSSDLSNWTRLDDPVYDCSMPGWSLCNAQLVNGGDFRDPFVMPDPAQPAERWLMYFVAHYADGYAPAGAKPDPWHNAYVLGAAAASTADPTGWSDAGAIPSTYRSSYSYYGSKLGSDRIESPHLFDHAGLWYLVFTPDPTKRLIVMTASDPLGPFTFLGNLDSLLARDTEAWFASDVFRQRYADGTSDDYFACVSDEGSARRIEIRQIQWGADGRFTLVDPIRVFRLEWTTTTVEEGGTATLRFYLANYDTVTRLAHLQVEELDGRGGRWPVDAARVGLPAAVPVVKRTWAGGWPAMTYAFAALVDPDDPDGDPTSTSFVVKFRGVESGVLTVRVRGVSGDLDRHTGDPLAARGDGGPRPGTTLEVVRGPSALPGLRVTLVSAEPARLELFDTSGRRVRVLLDGALPAGVTSAVWDGSDLRGAAAPPGLYLARLVTPSGTRVARVALLR
ncbi:MAG: hypothetical protein HZC42_11445 [Candidatus Eisenbacteria bacterium]|nr:hypothetical protein [Candidatus Eisenbacteria bacterium]